MASLTEQAVEQIKSMIVRGELRPGDRLPREQDLASQLGISRGSLREAVRALAVLKIIDVRRGDGTYVTSLAPELLLAAVDFVVDLQRDASSVLDFLAVRRYLEPECTSLAAVRIDAAGIDRLEQLVLEAEELARDQPVDHELMMANDRAFHAAVNAAGGNPVAAAIVAATAGVTTRIRINRSMAAHHAVFHTVDDHRMIFAAIAAHDYQLARLHAAAHIARTEDWVRTHLPEAAPAERASGREAAEPLA